MSHGGISLGIDLGTTYSVVSYLDHTGNVITLPNSDGDSLTPSAVLIHDNHALVGQDAKDAAGDSPNHLATVIKRDIGKPVYARTIDGREFRPETLSAIILRKLKQDAERRVGLIDRAVITVPAHFDDARRKATEDAGKIAGFRVVNILNEPSAAALAYSLEGKLSEQAAGPGPALPEGELTALVYDLGGGTFDVTAVRINNRRVDTLAVQGNVKLGGVDWDEKIIDRIAHEFQAQHGIEIPREEYIRLADSAEKLKKRLAKLPICSAECFYDGRMVSVSLSRKDFEASTKFLLVSTEAVIEGVRRSTRLHAEPGRETTWSDFDKILLVGGSTRMSAVKEMLTTLTGKVPDDHLDPDQVVSRGAAIYAAILASQEDVESSASNSDVHQNLRDIEVVNVNPHSLGIEAYSRKLNRSVTSHLIPKNTPLPHSTSKIFPLRKEGETQVIVKVLEGEAPESEANIELGRCVISGLPPGLPRKSPVQVVMSYEATGLVTVAALDMRGGTLAQAEIRRKNGLSSKEIRREIAFVNSLEIQ